MRKLAPARVSYRDDFFISYRVMIGSFHISLFEGTLHFDTRKIQNRKHYECAIRSSLPVDRFHTVARFRTGVKFSPRYNKRGELTPG